MQPSQTSIVDIRFSFNNIDMFKLLEERGKKLKNVKPKKVRKLETKMDSVKTEKFDRIRTPNTFYCTFEHNEASLALRNLDLSWMDHDIDLKLPKDPTDILWTNRGFSKKKRYCRFGCFAYLCVTIFFGMYGFTSEALNWNQLFRYQQTPPGINCESVKTRFGDQLVQMAYAEYQYNAINVFAFTALNTVFLNERISRTGALNCFCKDQTDKSQAFPVTTPTGEAESVTMCSNQNFGVFSIAFITS